MRSGSPTPAGSTADCPGRSSGSGEPGTRNAETIGTATPYRGGQDDSPWTRGAPDPAQSWSTLPPAPVNRESSKPTV